MRTAHVDGQGIGCLRDCDVLSRPLKRPHAAVDSSAMRGGMRVVVAVALVAGVVAGASACKTDDGPAGGAVKTGASVSSSSAVRTPSATPTPVSTVTPTKVATSTPAPSEPAAPAPAASAPAPAAPAPAAPAPAAPAAPADVYYKNCDAVRAAGKAPLYRGQPGYDSHLDRDGDGIACEK